MFIEQSKLTEIKGNTTTQKTMAIAIWLKHKLPDSRLKYYNLNRLAVASGIDYKTLKTYMPKLLEQRYVHTEGSEGKQILVVNNLASRNSHKNISLDNFIFDSWKSVKMALRALLIIRIVVGKEGLKKLLETCHDPKPWDNFKDAKRNVRKLVRKGVLKSIDQKYEEWGISLKRLAKEVGCSVATVEKIVNYAIAEGWLRKSPNVEQIYCKNVNYYDVEGATFTTKNNIYVVGANIYSLTPASIACFPSLSSLLKPFSSPSPNSPND